MDAEERDTRGNADRDPERTEDRDREDSARDRDEPGPRRETDPTTLADAGLTGAERTYEPSTGSGPVVPPRRRRDPEGEG